MGPVSGQWRCRVCGFDRWHVVSVRRKNGTLYTTSFYACSGCSGMFLNPEQWNELGQAAPNVEMPRVIALPTRKAYGEAVPTPILLSAFSVIA